MSIQYTTEEYTYVENLVSFEIENGITINRKMSNKSFCDDSIWNHPLKLQC